MGQALIIVESPAKAKTIKKYVGRNYTVKASVGHVKDLPQKELGVDVDHGFQPKYVVIKGKKKVLDEIKKASDGVEKIFLAPDPDREGEAIAWHIAEELGKKKKGKIFRILFNEITKNAIEKALKNPSALDQNKFESQQARRILDRLVGYKISPLLWQKVQRGLSAGRVQSVAVRIIVDQEREIVAFKPEEYWTIDAIFEAKGSPFEAHLFEVKGEKADVKTEAHAQKIVAECRNENFTVFSLKKKERKRFAPPPFTTSQLQQEGAKKLHFTAKKTMMIAQRLYEGVDLGEEGSVGLITYMRTDSVRVSDDALQSVREFIQSSYGKEYLPQTPNIFKSKKLAQEAHEAIRPTSLKYPPTFVQPYVEEDFFKLYELIWNRFVACQMAEAVFDQTTVDMKPAVAEYLFRATGSVLKFPGFMRVYKESLDELLEEKDKTLPDLNEGDAAALKEINGNQHFTEPPPRFTEASLVKELEENGIGRPSTYASILSTIQEKAYVKKEETRFHPTELGILVTDLLVESFPEILNVDFTANMEEQLDLIEEGKAKWVDTLSDFYRAFKQTLKIATTSMRNIKEEHVPTEHKCDKCGAEMVIKWGRRGKFLACSSYPECKNTKAFKVDEEGEITILEKEVTSEICAECGKPMAIKHGRFGRFLACSGYPDCRVTKALSLGVKCPRPDCGGDLVEKMSRRKKIFFSCSKYPKCDFAMWDKPVNRTCPQCSATILAERKSKSGLLFYCLDKECGYKITQSLDIVSNG